MPAEYLPQVLAIVGALVVVVNVITEVLKKLTNIQANWIAVAVSMALTLGAYFAWSAYRAMTVTWYTVAAAVVVGFLVAYAAMFGFDKLKQALEGK